MNNRISLRSNYCQSDFSQFIAEYSDVYRILNELSSFPERVEGIDAIHEMMNNGSTQYKQMEWIGFYIENWLEQRFPGFFSSRPKYQNTVFDMKLQHCDADVKAHTVLNARGKVNKSIILNDARAINNSIDANGFIVFCILSGFSEFDTTGEYQKEMDVVSGRKTSAYSLKKREEGAVSRARKKSFELSTIDILISKNARVDFVELSQGKNSNGKPRPIKYGVKDLDDSMNSVNITI